MLGGHLGLTCPSCNNRERSGRVSKSVFGCSFPLKPKPAPRRCSVLSSRGNVVALGSIWGEGDGQWEVSGSTPEPFSRNLAVLAQLAQHGFIQHFTLALDGTPGDGTLMADFLIWMWTVSRTVGGTRATLLWNVCVWDFFWDLFYMFWLVLNVDIFISKGVCHVSR